MIVAARTELAVGLWLAVACLGLALRPLAAADVAGAPWYGVGNFTDAGPPAERLEGGWPYAYPTTARTYGVSLPVRTAWNGVDREPRRIWTAEDSRQAPMYAGYGYTMAGPPAGAPIGEAPWTPPAPAVRADSIPIPRVASLGPSGGGGQQYQARRRGAVPSPALNAIAEHADQLVRHGFALAARRASFAGRADFIKALERIAQALDTETRGNYYSHCLAAGLRALEEADDFEAKGSDLAVDIDVPGLAAVHRTPVLKYVSLEGLTPLMAQQRYYAFAQEQLTEAAGDVPAASQALLGLGKVYVHWEPDSARNLVRHAPKAMVAFHAALQADQRNYLAANELGVLLARFGQLPAARAVLQHALTVAPTAESWHNLAVVHQRLGEVDLARLAQQQCEQLAGPQGPVPSPVSVEWLTAEQFAQLSPPPMAAEQPPVPARTARPPAAKNANGWRQASYRPLPTDAAPAPGQYPVRLCSGEEPASNAGPADPACATCGPPLWQAFGQGEYVGPARTQHVCEYRLRVDDQLECVYRLTREETATPYRLNVGDVIAVEFLADAKMDRGDIRQGQGLVIQPDGTITVHILGQVHAARLTVEELRSKLTEQYKQYYRDPQIIVTPLKVNAKLEDLRSAVDARFGEGGQGRRATVTPEGTIQLPALGSIPAQGLTLDELKREIDQRYAEIVDGIEVTPILRQRAPRYIYVVGEVRAPGRFTLEGPTTVMQGLAMAGGWTVGGNVQQVVVFRRTEDWRLLATRLDVRSALWGKNACPADEIWLRDADLVIVPKCSIKIATDLIELVFTRGLYGIVPVTYAASLGSMSLL